MSKIQFIHQKHKILNGSQYLDYDHITTTGEYILQHSCPYRAAHGSEGLWWHSRAARGKVKVLGFAIKSFHEWFSTPVHPSPNPVSSSMLRSRVHLPAPVSSNSAVPLLIPVLAWTLLCLPGIHFSFLFVLWPKKCFLVSQLRPHSSLHTQRPLHTICILFPFNSPS